MSTNSTNPFAKNYSKQPLIDNDDDDDVVSLARSIVESVCDDDEVDGRSNSHNSRRSDDFLWLFHHSSFNSHKSNSINTQHKFVCFNFCSDCLELPYTCTCFRFYFECCCCTIYPE
jgi:hypothetical protein